MTPQAAGEGARPAHPQTNLAVGLAAAAVLAMVVLSAAGADGPIWIVQGVLAASAAVVAWRAGGTSPANRLAFAAFVVGAVLLALFIGFLIAEA